MGLSPFKKSCSSNPYVSSGYDAPNPNPEVFKILHEEYRGGFLILLVNYPHCTNFEGTKLMVYRGFRSSQELLARNLGKLDPHFSRERGSPIARFKPTQQSLELIERMINGS